MGCLRTELRRERNEDSQDRTDARSSVCIPDSDEKFASLPFLYFSFLDTDSKSCVMLRTVRRVTSKELKLKERAVPNFWLRLAGSGGKSGKDLKTGGLPALHNLELRLLLSAPY